MVFGGQSERTGVLLSVISMAFTYERTFSALPYVNSIYREYGGRTYDEVVILANFRFTYKACFYAEKEYLFPDSKEGILASTYSIFKSC